MKAVILAGGRGRRMSERTAERPKPMVEIGGRPILWHIMKAYEHHGVNDFVVCLGYRGEAIKEYFANYHLHRSDLSIDLRSNSIEYLSTTSEPWRVTLIDTGAQTLTGGRLRRARDRLGLDEPFCATYADGLADVDVSAQLDFHKAHGRLVTMTVVPQPGRFGQCRIDGDRVVTFAEKSEASNGFINGGFFVVSPEALDEVEGDDTAWEGRPLERLAAAGEVAAWQHDGFWHPMDTVREQEVLEDLWNSPTCPWRVWE